MKTFNYKKSFRVINWGYSFDSMLELKYAISVQKDYEYLRSHIPIYYDPKTKLPTFYLRGNIRRYTPDFLIRHKVTKKAFLVEIKPRAFEGNEQLSIRKEVAKNYIHMKQYDWEFKVVYSDEIKLSANEQTRFLNCFKLIPGSERKFMFKELNDRFDQSRPSLFRSPPSGRQIHFVMFGEEKHSFK
jgi:hypothetical protein